MPSIHLISIWPKKSTDKFLASSLPTLLVKFPSCTFPSYLFPSLPFHHPMVTI